MQIIKGRLQAASRILIYGPAGVGKSTWACSCPGALALDCESGLDQIGADRVKLPDRWTDTLRMVSEMSSGGGDHKAVVIDTVDRLEDQLTEDICSRGKKRTLGDFGFGEGYEQLASGWRGLLQVLECARVRNREVILVAHVQQKAQVDPTLGTYDKYVPVLNKKTWALTHRWADAVLFADYERALVGGLAKLTGERSLGTVSDTGYEAKNRWNLPRSLPLKWEAFAEARSR